MVGCTPDHPCVRTRPRCLVLLPVLVAALVLTGCDGAAKRSGSPRTWTLTFDASRVLRLGAQADDADVVGDTAVFAFSDRRHGPEGQIGSLDLRTGRRTVLARTQFPGGAIAEVVRAGREIVYLDTSDPGTFAPGASKWRVIVLSTHRMLATSGDRRVTMPPDLMTIGDSAVWTVYPANGGDGAHAYGWKPGGAVVRRDALPGDELECRPPAPSAEGVEGCDQKDGWIAWGEKAYPGAVTDEDNPIALYVARNGRPGREKIGVVHDDSSGAPAIFGGFVIWSDDHGVRVTSIEHPGASVAIPDTATDNARVGHFATRDGRAAVIVSTGGSSTLQVIDPSQLHLTSS